MTVTKYTCVQACGWRGAASSRTQWGGVGIHPNFRMGIRTNITVNPLSGVHNMVNPIHKFFVFVIHVVTQLGFESLLYTISLKPTHT